MNAFAQYVYPRVRSSTAACNDDMASCAQIIAS